MSLILEIYLVRPYHQSSVKVPLTLSRCWQLKVTDRLCIYFSRFLLILMSVIQWLSGQVIGFLILVDHWADSLVEGAIGWVLSVLYFLLSLQKDEAAILILVEPFSH